MSTETGKRVRKQTQIFNVAVEEKKVVEGGEGTGITLGDYPYFLEQLENFTGADEVLKGLHLFLFGRGKKMEIKKHLKTFNGFPEDTDLDERIQHIVERKKNWTVAVLKDALGLFGLEKGGDREHLIERLVKYLAKPEVLKSVNNGAKKATTTKATTGTKRKAATKKEKGGPKKKRAPSAFILFTTAHRAEVKKQNPEASFGDLSRMVSELWKSASDKEKAKWQKKSDEAKEALAEEEAAQGVADDFEESEGEQEEEEGEGEEEGEEEGEGEEEEKKEE